MVVPPIVDRSSVVCHFERSAAKSRNLCTARPAAKRSLRSLRSVGMTCGMGLRSVGMTQKQQKRQLRTLQGARGAAEKALFEGRRYARRLGVSPVLQAWPNRKTAMPWGSMITCVIAGGSPPHRFSASNVRERSFTLREACNSRRETSASLINPVGPYEAGVPRTSQSFNYYIRTGRDYSSSSSPSPSKSSSMKTA